jgi:hypothetical protein
MKEKIKNLVNEPWYWLIMTLVMFFGGLFVAGTEERYTLAKFIIGLIWFGGLVFWMASMMNKWWLKYHKK